MALLQHHRPGPGPLTLRLSLPQVDRQDQPNFLLKITFPLIFFGPGEESALHPGKFYIKEIEDYVEITVNICSTITGTYTVYRYR